MKQNGYVRGLSSKVTSISVVLVLERGLHILHLLQERKETFHRRTFFSFMRIQAKRNYHKKKQLKLVTDNLQQLKRSKRYADVVVNITDKPELCCKIKSNNDTSPDKNKKDLKGTVQKSIMSKEELKSQIIYCQTLRLSNICTYEEDFHKALNMKWWFFKRDNRKRWLIYKWEKLNLINV